MIDFDKGFMEDPPFDPDDVFGEDWEEGFGNGDGHCSLDGLTDDDCLFDTYDEVTGDLDDVTDELGIYDFVHDPDAMGMAFALADEMTDTKGAHQYDIDEKTDSENMEQAMRQNYPMNGKRLRPFERIINDICSGKRSALKTDDL